MEAGRGGGGAGGAIAIVCNTFGGTSGQMVADGGGGANGGGGGGLFAVWVGVSESAREEYTNQVIRDATNKFYGGMLSVTNGLGFTNIPPGGSECGTAYFFTPKPTLGSVMLFR
jgi:hypothetical protein